MAFQEGVFLWRHLYILDEGTHPLPPVKGLIAL